MNHQVRVFELAKGAKIEEKPRPIDGFAVTAESLEDARRAVLARFSADGRAVRSISFTDGGGLAAVVHPPEPPASAAPPTARSCRARGGR